MFKTLALKSAYDDKSYGTWLTTYEIFNSHELRTATNIWRLGRQILNIGDW